MKIENENIQSVYINPLTDFGFKKLFLNKELLIAFLNDVVGTDINEVTYLPTEGLGEYRYERMETYQRSLKQNFYLRDIAKCAKLEGEQIGIVKEKKQFAIKLLKKGTPIEEVIYLTELSKEQVLEILNQLPKS